MDTSNHTNQVTTGAPAAPQVDSRANEQSYAIALDERDPLTSFRSQFFIPTKADLKRRTIANAEDVHPDLNSAEELSLYMCGNSLGLQPRRTSTLISEFLSTWSSKAVTGHFVGHEDTDIPPYLHVDDYASELMAPVVGAKKDEVVVMGTLTGNLHLLMSSFYRPAKREEPEAGRYKIILEGKAFPSDHYAIESQIQYHGYHPKDAMIMIKPLSGSDIITDEQIFQTIEEHAPTTALLLLPGVQFYTGQYFDIPAITRFAHEKGIMVGWDCAHAVGNLPLQLHEWDVDFAVWCNYKYVNSGPGAIAGAFVHEKHGMVDMNASKPEDQFRPRLAGWWGADKSRRFEMDNNFIPRPGAPGYQLSNPSALDLTAVISSLQIFSEATMPALRQKSIDLTAYLERLLLDSCEDSTALFTIITPSDPERRGAQLSIKLARHEYLNPVLEYLSKNGVVVDERKPDVVRVAPCPLYNSFEDVWRFVQVYTKALGSAAAGDSGGK